MIAGTDRALLGERLVSGAASGVLSIGMVVALVGLSSAGTVRQTVRPSLSTFDLGAGANGETDTDPAMSKAPAAASTPQAPPEAQAPPPPRTPPLAERAPAEVPERTEPLPAPAQSSTRLADVPSPPSNVQVAATALTQRPAAPRERATDADASSHARASTGTGGTNGGYKAEVWRHLQRFRRPNAVGAGSAFVRFAIGTAGNVLDLAIARSSGSKRFDGEALTLVRRAQPFPPPPTEAGHAFVFEITGS